MNKMKQTLPPEIIWLNCIVSTEYQTFVIANILDYFH